MTRNDHDRNTCSQNEKSRCLPIKLSLGRSTPTRVRKFIPKPLILVERMKASKLLLELSSPCTSGASLSPESHRQTMVLAPPSPLHVTPTPGQKLPYDVLSSVSYSSGSVSFRVPSQDSVVFGSGFGRISPQSRRRLSVATSGNSSASTDTFVADSPCFSKRASRFPVLVTETNTTNIHVDVGHRKRRSVGIGVSVRFDPSLATSDLVHNIGYSSDPFEPGITSTPFGSSQANASRTLTLTQFVPSIVHPTRVLEQASRVADTTPEIVSPTSRAICPFNGHKDAYTVKLPSYQSTDSPLYRPSRSSSRTVPPYLTLSQSDAPLVPLANLPRPALDFKRPLSRVASPPPTLVLDGVFALLHAPTPALLPGPRRMLNAFPRPRKPAPRRCLTNMSNALPVARPLSQPVSVDTPLISPTTPDEQSGSGPHPESPRSKLAHVLTAHIHLETTVPAMRKPKRVPSPTVTDAQAPNGPRVEGLRIRKKAGSARGSTGGSNGGGSGPKGGKDDDASGGKGAIERMSFAGVGMVARLRARWERGVVEP